MPDSTRSPIRRVLVIGAGSWGTTVANLLARKGLEVAIWAREAGLAADIERRHENRRYLPGVPLDPRLRGVSVLATGLDGVQMVVLGIPAQSLRAVLGAIRPHLAEHVVVLNLAKGLEEGTGARCSEIVFQELRQSNPVAVLAGPNIAYEVVRGIPSKAVVACSNYRYLPLLRDTFTTPCFKVYANPDLAGVELGGALKNVVAIMAGIGDGLGFGANTKSAVLTRGLRDMVKLGVLMGGHRETFFGLSGIGDLMATSLSPHSRNRTLGERLGRGASLAEAEASLHGRVAEGVRTTRALVEMKEGLDVDSPVVDTLYRVLYEDLPPREGYLAIWNTPGGNEAD